MERMLRKKGGRFSQAPGWSKGATNAATKAIQLRVALGDYIHEQLAIASATGTETIFIAMPFRTENRIFVKTGSR